MNCWSAGTAAKFGCFFPYKSNIVTVARLSPVFLPLSQRSHLKGPSCVSMCERRAEAEGYVFPHTLQTSTCPADLRCSVSAFLFGWSAPQIGHTCNPWPAEQNLYKATLAIFFGPWIPTRVFQPCRRKKIEKKNSMNQILFFLVGHFFADFAHFFDRNTTQLVTKILQFLACRRKN